MERREFLKWSAVTGLASAAGAPSEVMGAIPHPGLDESGPDLKEYLHRMDKASAGIGTSGLRLPAELQARVCGTSDPDALIRKSIQSLLVVGMFQDLPEAQRMHPEVQRRLELASPDMNDAVLGMAAVLANNTPEERNQLQEALRREPDLVMRIGGILDEEASALDVPMKRRWHLRKLMSNIAWRMKRQSPELLIEEVLGKSRRFAAHEGVGEQFELALVAEPHSLAQGTPVVAGEASSPSGELAPAPEPGARAVQVGRILLGLGTGLAVGGFLGFMLAPGGGLGPSSGQFAGLVGVTIGALLLLVGLIVLVVGLARKNRTAP